MTILASTAQAQRGGGARQLRMRVPRVHAYFTGTGGLGGGQGWRGLPVLLTRRDAVQSPEDVFSLRVQQHGRPNTCKQAAS